MGVIESTIDRDSGVFRERTRHMESLVSDLTATLATIREGGGEKAQERHRAKGKMPVRERINRLLDPGSPFLEVGPMAAYGVYESEVPAAGAVAGIGRVRGVECMIVGNDATVKGGTYFPMTVKKHLRAQTIAGENHLPCIYLVDSGGANLPQQDEVFRITIISAISSSAKPTCPRKGFPRLPWSWVPAPPVAPTCPPWQMRPSWSRARAPSIWPAPPGESRYGRDGHR